MNCQEIQALSHAYADRELDLVRTNEIEQHLSGCPGCSQAYENLRSLSSAIKSADVYFKAPAQLVARVRRSVVASEHSSVGPTERATLPRSRAQTLLWFRSQWLKWLIPITGTALVTFVVAAMLLGPSAGDRLAQDVMASHVRSLMANHLTDVASSDQHTVKPWFDGKVDFAPLVENLAERGFPLVGGRLDYLQNRPVAALVYQRQKHFINLFVWPATRSSSTSGQLVVRQGYNLIHWNDSGMTYWAVSDLNPRELREFSEMIKGAGK